LYRANEGCLAATRQRLDEPRHIGRVSERVAQPANGSGQAVFKVDECFGPPQVLSQVVPSLLGLNLIPPSVERLVNDRPAAVIWWIDDVAMNELGRRRNRIDPPDPERWDRQVQAVRLFDELISTPTATYPALYLNSIWDNLVVTTDWTVRISEHTGAFRAFATARHRQSRPLSTVSVRSFARVE
jgi:hypothetical protein